MIRFLTAGESHGPGLVAIVEGLPAGLPVAAAGLSYELQRRRMGYGRGNRMKIEKDELEILAGVRHGRTLGSPVAVLIRNTEWPRWREEMSPEPGEPRRTMTTPRPGHADLAGMLKYDTHDARDILERSSARETAARTIVGYLCKQLLAEVGVGIVGHVVAIGSVAASADRLPVPEDRDRLEESPVRVLNEADEHAMIAEIDTARADRDTLGGVVEVIAYGLPAGVGSHVHWDRRLDARLAEALMSIQAIKAVEVGDGIATARERGSSAHDEIFYEDATWRRNRDRAGGTEGGMSTGQPLRVRASMKPIATLMRPLASVDVTSKEPDVAFRERSDTCAVPAAAVVAEQMVAYVLADELQRSLGGDTVQDFRRSFAAYRARLDAF